MVPSQINPIGGNSADNGTTPHSVPLIVYPDIEKYSGIQNPKGNTTSSGNESTSNNKGTETNNTPESSPAISKTPANTRETTVREPEPMKPEVKEAKVEVPNVFTPNFDRNNDYFELISEENVSKVEITIYDPNGRKVFISNDINFKWDGNNMSGEACGQGIYSYQMVYFDLNGKANLKGDYIYLQR
jgi:gliding motility-associated-like protein